MMRGLRFLAPMALALGLAQQAHAQMAALPVYFSPKGGVGITLDGDFGRISSAKLNDVPVANHPTAIGGRAYLGLPFVTLGVGASVYDTKIVAQTSSTQYMGSAAFKVFGGPLVPIAISFQAGAGYLKRGSGSGALKQVSLPIGLGVGLNLPTPGASLEPWVAGRLQVSAVSTGSGSSSASSTRVGPGVSGGLNLGLPIGLGLHVAVDWSSLPAKATSPVVSERFKLDQLVIGVGLHYMIRLPGLPGVPVVPGV